MLEDKGTMYEFEQWVCLDKPQLWVNEAHNLFYSAEVLHKFEQIKNSNFWEIKNKEFFLLFPENISKGGGFNFRVQRMLWAYGFENLFKTVMVMEFKKSGRTEISKDLMNKLKSHNLIDLAEKAKIKLLEPENFYLKILTICSVWAGRYPLPTKPEDMYEQREPLSSREELFERQDRLWKLYVSGKIPRTFHQSDVIHSGVGTEEIDIYRQLKEKLLSLVSTLE